jgi:hypothetical protein
MFGTRILGTSTPESEKTPKGYNVTRIPGVSRWQPQPRKITRRYFEPTCGPPAPSGVCFSKSKGLCPSSLKGRKPKRGNP